MRTRPPPRQDTDHVSAMEETLRSMQRSWGVDNSVAAGLSGDALQAWIDAALDADFEKDFAEFSAVRAALADGGFEPR